MDAPPDIRYGAVGVVFDPVPVPAVAGTPDDGVVGVAAPGALPPPAELHLLAGGVLTLHAWGSASARVLSMVTPPRDEESPLSAAQRHCGLVCTTLASCEQHEDGGADTLPLM